MELQTVGIKSVVLFIIYVVYEVTPIKSITCLTLEFVLGQAARTKHMVDDGKPDDVQLVYLLCAGQTLAKQIHCG